MKQDRSITIGVVEPAEIQRCVEITQEAFNGVSLDQAVERQLGSRCGRSWQDIKGEQVRREMQQTPQHCFVARAGSSVVGCVTNEVDMTTLRGRIMNLAVDGSCRGQGIGRLLIERSLEYFRGLGLKQARIETLATNAVGQHLYPSCGFVEIVRQVHYAMNL